MMQSITSFADRIELFKQKSHRDLLCCNLQGIEREGLRVLNEQIAQSAHPKPLGSTLTHPLITTDFSEALLEFITDPFPRTEDLIKQLRLIHAFTAQNLNANEFLWATSMPCRLGDDDSIPIAQYGSSNAAQMKTIYRRGLGLRYGRKMQTIAGIHYNFSIPDAVWSLLRTQDSSHERLQDYKTAGYMGLTRNFRRWFWLLLYLTGASPVVDKSFVESREHNLCQAENSEHDLYLPKATSLRMGNLGYQSSAQDQLYVCYDNIDSYVRSLQKAILQKFEPYATSGIQNSAGDYQQLSGAVLQIENEFYSTIRPKQTALSGETQLSALCQRGIEYIEVRCIDVNPWSDIGISQTQMNFLELFLLACLFDKSPTTCKNEYAQVLQNQKTLVESGRSANVELIRNGNTVAMRDWANEIMGKIQSIAALMDKLTDDNRYSNAFKHHQVMLNDVEHTPSAKMMKELQEQKIGFVSWTKNQSLGFHQQLREMQLDTDDLAYFQQLTKTSLEKQTLLESAEAPNFEDYLKDYYQQYRQI